MVITEIGGTVGDIESLPFLEAIRQFPVDVGRRRCMYIHLTLVPYIGHAGELKTKPTQHSVNELRRIGIQPDMVVCRSEGGLPSDVRKKIALFASLPMEAIVSARDVDNIYKVPLYFHAEGVDDFVLEHFGIEASRRPTSATGSGSCAAPARPRTTTRCGSRSSASTSSSRTRTCRSPRRCATPASSTAARSRSTGWTPRRSTTSEVRDARRAGRRHPHPRRLRRARDRGQDHRLADRARAEDPVPRHLPRHADGGGRLRAPRGRHGRRELDRVRPRDAVPGDRPAARAEGGRRHGRHDAPGRRPDQAARGHQGARALRRGRDLRAPPASLRGQQLPAQAARGRGPRDLGHVAGRPAGRDHRDPRPPVLRGLAVPPGVQVAPRAPGAAVPRVRGRRARPRPRAPCRRRSRRTRPHTAREARVRGREGPARRAVRGAVPHPEPVRARARVRRPRDRRAARHGPRGRGGRDRQPAGADLDGRARALGAAVRAPRHRRDRRRRSSRCSSTAAGRTPTTASSAPTTRPRWR